MFERHNTVRIYLLAGLVSLLAACAGRPPIDAPRPPPVASAIEKFKADLGDGLMLDYQIERKISSVNNKSCYAFITGRISNLSGKTLSRRSVLDVPVFSQGKLLYRDNTSPLADIPPGSNADFEMVVSPVFADGCPRFDRINPVLRKAFL